MKATMLVVAAVLSIGLVAGIAPQDEKPIATSGAQIRVFKAEKGYELEVSWSGGQPEDIAIFGVAGPSFQVYQRASPLDPLWEGEQLVWHAGESGTVRIPVAPTQVDDRNRSEDPLRAGWTAALKFVPRKVNIPICERTVDKPTKGKPFAEIGEWKRDISFTAEEIGRAPCMLVDKSAERRESIFRNTEFRQFEYDWKTEERQALSGPTQRDFKGVTSDMWNQQQIRLQVTW